MRISDWSSDVCSSDLLGNFNNATAVSYGDYSEVGARATLRIGRYEFGPFVQNIFDKRGRVAARTFFLSRAEIRQKPRTFGASLRAKWWIAERDLSTRLDGDDGGGERGRSGERRDGKAGGSAGWYRGGAEVYKKNKTK